MKCGKLDTGLAPRSVLHIHHTLSKALKQATDDGLIPRNVAAPVKPPRPRGEEIKPLDREQVRALFEPKGGYVFEAPKSGKGRQIRLTQRATAALREHRKRQLEERIRRGDLWSDQGLVFPSTVGTPLLGGNVNRAFKAMLKRAGLPDTTRFHDLRQTCATLLLRQGVNPKFVQELLATPT